MIDWDTFKEQLQTKPEKSLKSVLLLAGLLLLIWILFVVQADPIAQNKVQVKPSGHLNRFRIDSLDVKDRLAESSAKNEPSLFSQSTSKNDSFSWLPAAVVLFAIVGGAWLWIRTKKNKQGPKIKGQIYTTIATQQLPGGQQLMAVKLNKEYWIMTVGGHNGVKLLHRYSEDEWNGIEQEPSKGNWKKTLSKALHSTEIKTS